MWFRLRHGRPPGMGDICSAPPAISTATYCVGRMGKIRAPGDDHQRAPAPDMVGRGPGLHGQDAATVHSDGGGVLSDRYREPPTVPRETVEYHTTQLTRNAWREVHGIAIPAQS